MVTDIGIAIKPISDLWFKATLKSANQPVAKVKVKVQLNKRK